MLMRMRWRMILPLFGLILFTLVSYHSFFVRPIKGSGRYQWWSGIRLDSDPLEKRPRPQILPAPAGSQIARSASTSPLRCGFIQDLSTERFSLQGFRPFYSEPFWLMD